MSPKVRQLPRPEPAGWAARPTRPTAAPRRPRLTLPPGGRAVLQTSMPTAAAAPAAAGRPALSQARSPVRREWSALAVAMACREPARLRWVGRRGLPEQSEVVPTQPVVQRPPRPRGAVALLAATNQRIAT